MHGLPCESSGTNSALCVPQCLVLFTGGLDVEDPQVLLVLALEVTCVDAAFLVDQINSLDIAMLC